MHIIDTFKLGNLIKGIRLVYPLFLDNSVVVGSSFSRLPTTEQSFSLNLNLVHKSHNRFDSTDTSSIDLKIVNDAYSHISHLSLFYSLYISVLLIISSTFILLIPNISNYMNLVWRPTTGSKTLSRTTSRYHGR